METLQFYDLVAKKRFKSNKYKMVIKGNRQFAVATNPSGNKSWLVRGMKPGYKKKKPKRKKRK